jgi:hypothetical protein
MEFAASLSNFATNRDTRRPTIPSTEKEEKDMKSFLTRLILVPAIFSIAFSTGKAQAGDREAYWKPYEFLVGEWVAEGSGKPGEGTGRFSIYFEKQNFELVRQSIVNFPAMNGKPAFEHTDHMIMILEELPGSINGNPAWYSDNEEHVIQYKAHFSNKQDSLIFVSDAKPGEARYRFTYVKQAGGRLKTLFEVAPPGKPAEFSLYVEGYAKKKS